MNEINFYKTEELMSVAPWANGLEWEGCVCVYISNMFIMIARPKGGLFR